jgi:hypothetical protein
MTPIERSRWRRAATLTAVALMVVFGCGTDDGLGKRYPVSGTVNYKGQPVPSGTISFIPDKADGRAANGTIEAGSFTLMTLTEGDGALPGTYKVTVVAKETGAVTASKFGGAPSQQQSFQANKAAKSLIPAKYGSATTTDLKAEVKAESNKANFELTD